MQASDLTRTKNLGWTDSEIEEAQPRIGRFGRRKLFSQSIEIPELSGKRLELRFVLGVLARKYHQVIGIHLGLGNPFRDQLGRKMADIAFASFFSTMQQLADMWIDSGKSADKVTDRPLDRNVEDTAPGHDDPLYSYLIRSMDYVRLNLPELTRDGTQVDPIQCFHVDTSAFDKGIETLDDMSRRFGKEVAVYWFRRLLNTPFSRHFSRCDECLKYFEYARAVRGVIKRGIYCDQCKSKGASKRNKLSRSAAHQKLIVTAATAWGNWSPTKRVKQAEWTLRAVNKVNGLDLKKAWITRNLHAIQTQQNEQERMQQHATL